VTIWIIKRFITTISNNRFKRRLHHLFFLLPGWLADVCLSFWPCVRVCVCVYGSTYPRLFLWNPTGPFSSFLCIYAATHFRRNSARKAAKKTDVIMLCTPTRPAALHPSLLHAHSVVVFVHHPPPSALKVRVCVCACAVF